eukprot:scaffold62016_cov17-Prasinocladus_malaysianus.AAC.1
MILPTGTTVLVRTPNWRCRHAEYWFEYEYQYEYDYCRESAEPPPGRASMDRAVCHSTSTRTSTKI